MDQRIQNFKFALGFLGFIEVFDLVRLVFVIVIGQKRAYMAKYDRVDFTN
jgi:hypothetical protein